MHYFLHHLPILLKKHSSVDIKKITQDLQNVLVSAKYPFKIKLTLYHMRKKQD